MNIVVGREDTHLWMKHARGAGNRFNIIVAARTTGALLAQTRPNTFRIGENQSLSTAASDETIKDDGFEKR
ncbi:hypothetical protein GCM10016234_39660 [Tianweitania populi]|uniref:Uncharacterized protein n=1 Tax=Tianweitania populi TaxID=1607949 RepID=A0A8J3DYD6_9HYPH|nr:hypothetical protein GCM10016234_39660 [Tianweitania populi]